MLDSNSIELIDIFQDILGVDQDGAQEMLKQYHEFQPVQAPQIPHPDRPNHIDQEQTASQMPAQAAQQSRTRRETQTKRDSMLQQINSKVNAIAEDAMQNRGE